MIETVQKEFKATIVDVVDKIQQVQLEMFATANKSVLELYFYIGETIENNIQWGNKFVDELSFELKIRFPKAKGYSPRNLRNMRKYYLSVKENEELKELSYKIPWSHNTIIMDRVKNDNEKIWYIKETYNNGWSYDYLEIQVKRDAYSRQILGDKPNNFGLTLLQPQSSLAKEIMKDPYIFDVGELRENYVEKDVENALIEKIKMTLLELGNGFSFIANQYRVTVNKEENYIDLLFYHTKLHCYVAVELKAVEFIPEFVSKLNFYISAIDEYVKLPEDKPTIGLLICRTKSNTKAKFALRGISQPLGIAQYETEKLFADVASSLPQIEDIDNELDSEKE